VTRVSEVKDIKRQSWLLAGGVSTAAILGMVLIFFSTRWGPGVGGDATIYITSAQNLLAGKGLGLIEADGSFRLLPYSAPFFPIVLAFLNAFGLEIVQSARFLNLLLFGGLILLSGKITKEVTRSAWLAICVSLLLALSPILTPVFSWAMAEPLTLVLGFGGLFLMASLIKQPSNKALLFLSAVLTGLAFLTRYSAAAFIAAAGLGWLLLSHLPWRKKIIQGLVFGVIALLPMLVWVLVQLSYTSGVSSRSMEDAAGMAGRLASFLPQFGDVLLSWLLPASWIDAPSYPRLINTILTWGFVLVQVGLGVFFFRRGKEKEKVNSMTTIWPALVSIFLLTYTSLIFMTYLTTYPPITLDNRMFSPAHTGVLILLPIFLWSAGTRLFPPKSRWITILPVVLVMGFVLWYASRDIRIVKQNYEQGLGYTSPAWRNSELIAWVRQTPPETKLITNETMAVLFLTGRTAYPFAEIYLDHPLESYMAYGSDSESQDSAQKLFRESQTPLVLFNTVDTQFQSIYGSQTSLRIQKLVEGLKKDFQGSDGAVYYAPH
jgi:hypothetical protein